MIKPVLVLLLSITFLVAFSQNSKKDSLKQRIIVLKNQPVSYLRDTSLSKTLNLYARCFGYTAPDTAIVISSQALKIAKKANWFFGSGISYHQLGLFMGNKGDFTGGINQFESALKIWTKEELSSDSTRKKLGKKNKSKTLMSIGIAYDNMGNYPQALDYYLKALYYNEQAKNKGGQATVFGNIGLVYSNLKKHKTAIEFYTKALVIDSTIKNYVGVGRHLGNIAIVYNDLKKYDVAIDYYFRALKLKEQYSDQFEVAYTLGNIGNTYAALAEQNNDRSLYAKALEYDNKALQILQQIGDESGKARNLGNIGIVYNNQNNSPEAKKYLLQAIALCDKTGMLKEKMDFELVLSNVYLEMGDHKESLLHYKSYAASRDSIFNVEKNNEITSKQLTYDFEKKKTEQEIRNNADKEKIKAVAVETEKKQQFTIIFIISILVIVLIFSVFLYSRFKVTQKQKHIIEAKEKETQSQNVIITQQKHLVEEKHREITDSINYAERIQRSFLATKELLDENLKDYFILFKPKDIVSGDFYWAGKLDNGNFALVTADSTGHGVPGAIMSLLNVTSIEKAIEHYSDPADILNHTRQTIIERLKKDGSFDGGKDGMDCSLLAFDFANKALLIAAANNPVWIIRNNEMIEIKPDKMPVGKNDRQNESFGLHTIDLQKGDTIYALTDGFPDQFGGPNGKKFMSKKLKELLLTNVHLTIPRQRELLETSFNNWKGDQEQIDDVTIVGIRI